MRQRTEAETLRREVAQATRSAAAKLRAAGLSRRDVGDLIGVSGARVGQIVSTDPVPEFQVRCRRVKRLRKLGEAIIPAEELVSD